MKSFKFFIVVALAFTSFLYGGTYSGGDGSFGNPYKIATTDDLIELSNASGDWGDFFIQTMDITFDPNEQDVDWDGDGSATWDAGDQLGFDPIGTSGTYFTGEYNGDGYKIINLFIDRGSTDYVGLFRILDVGEIRKVGLEDVDITGRDFTGALVGRNYKSVTTSYSTGIVTGNDYVGGLVGHNMNNGGTGTITNCYSSVDVTGVNHVGGLLGRLFQGSVSYIFSYGSVTGSTSLGGLIGSLNTGSVTDSFWHYEESGLSYSGGSEEGKVLGEVVKEATFTNWDFTTVWTINENSSYPYLQSTEETPNPEPPATTLFDGGTGISSDPFQVATADQLNNVRIPVSGHFIQTADIDLDVAPYNTGSSRWEPLAAAAPFTGVYDGDGNTISNMHVTNSAGDYAGLFSDVRGGEIRDLGLVSATVTCTDRVGALVGINYGTILRCYVTGAISGNDYVGGLCGQIGAGAVITDCYSRVNVGASGTYIGGLVGRMDDGDINTSYSTGNVDHSGSSGGFIGAFAGGTISDCFWDNETSSFTTSAGSASGKTTAEMKTQSTFTNAGWSGSVWNIGDGINDGYPYLDWQNTGGTPLPVELNSFKGSKTQEGVVLNWETATEINNFGFEIERSQPVLSGVEEWAKVGFVQGHGTTNSPKDYEFTDSELPDADEISYRLKQIDNDGTFAYSKIINVDLTTITSVDDKIVYEFVLEQNYPNPFNPSTTIKFTVPTPPHPSPYQGEGAREGLVLLRVYDILGRKVATLINQKLQPGNHEVQFDASHLSSGIYFYRIDVGNQFTSIKKMLMVK